MSAGMKLPDDDPRVIAWERFKTAPEFGIIQYLADSPGGAGALWGAFIAGFAARERDSLTPSSQQAQPAPSAEASHWIDKAMELADVYAEKLDDCPSWREHEAYAARAALRAHLEQMQVQAVASQASIVEAARNV